MRVIKVSIERKGNENTENKGLVWVGKPANLASRLTDFAGKTVEDAVMEAAIKLETTSDKLDYEILEKGSSGFLGIGSKPAKIKARKLMETVDRVEEFLADVFAAMQIDAKIEITENKEENTMSVRADWAQVLV